MIIAMMKEVGTGGGDFVLFCEPVTVVSYQLILMKEVEKGRWRFYFFL
jgi:hypothetical protein